MQRSFGQEFRSLREARGLSVRKLSLKAGVKPFQITHLEQGKKVPSKGSALQNLLSALEVSDDQLKHLRSKAAGARVMKLLEKEDQDEPFIRSIKSVIEFLQTLPESELRAIQSLLLTWQLAKSVVSSLGETQISATSLMNFSEGETEM